MLNSLYSFLHAPKKTIQLRNHTKDWKLWWLIIGVSALISAVKFSNIGIISLFFHVVFILFLLIMMSVIIDVSAQFFGAKSHFKTILYWLAFANVVYWLAPSILNIQVMFYSVGAILMLILHGFYISYFFKILKTVYQLTYLRLIAITFVPIFFFLISIIAILVYGAQYLLMGI